jgi:peptidoglycan/xylan/chitin deacetylase (PgdA/CDA1 family)
MATADLASRVLHYSGAVALWERFANRGRPRVVYWHDVHAPEDDITWCREPSLSLPVALFRRQVEFLCRHFTVVGLDEAVAAASPRVVALTFDDGYRGVYTRAFPVLREYGLPATVFLVTERIGSAAPLWWDELVDRTRAFRRLPAYVRAGTAASLGDPWAELLMGPAAEEEIVRRYKRADAADRARLDVALAPAAEPPPASGERVFLSQAEIREMQAAGISFGAHTRTHPLLTWLTDAALHDELAGSKQRVEAITGGPACWFAYPDGTFTERDMEAVRGLGFAGAVQTFRRPDLAGRYAVARVGLDADVTTDRAGRLAPARLRCTLAGLTRQRLRSTLRLGRTTAP